MRRCFLVPSESIIAKVVKNKDERPGNEKMREKRSDNDSEKVVIAQLGPE